MNRRMDRISRSASAAAAAAFLLCLPVLSFGTDLDALLAKTVDAYGGREALSRSCVVRQTGRVVIPGGGKGDGALTRIFRKPDKLRIEISYPMEPTEVRILSGAKGWRQGQAVFGPAYDAMALQAARIALPLNLLEGKRNLKLLGDAEKDGKRLGVLEFALGGGMTLTVEIEKETGYIVRTVGKSAGMGKGSFAIEFVATYGDFRKADGLLFAFREGNFAMANHTGDTILEKVEILDNIDAETFLPAGRGGRQ